MPDRIIRDRSRSSPTLQSLSDAAERAWWRLTVSCDDHGRFDADPDVLLAELFKRRPTGWTRSRIEKCLSEWEASELILLYSIGDRPYGQIASWASHQRPPRLASKFPDPPDTLSIPSESTIHGRVWSWVNSQKIFCGFTVSQIDRNVRVATGFADLVLLTEHGRILVEIKRTRADRGAIKQVIRYRDSMDGVFASVVIANGVGPGVSEQDFTSNHIALIVFEEGVCSLLYKSDEIQVCDLVISGEITRRTPNQPVILHDCMKREARSEKREARSEKREEDGTEANGSPPLPTSIIPPAFYNAGGNGLPEWFRLVLSKSPVFAPLATGEKAFWDAMSKAYDPYEWLKWDEELQKADVWIAANPQRKPRALKRFIRNWFERTIEHRRKYAAPARRQ